MESLTIAAAIIFITAITGVWTWILVIGLDRAVDRRFSQRDQTAGETVEDLRDLYRSSLPGKRQPAQLRRVK